MCWAFPNHIFLSIVILLQLWRSKETAIPEDYTDCGVSKTLLTIFSDLKRCLFRIVFALSILTWSYYMLLFLLDRFFFISAEQFRCPTCIFQWSEVFGSSHFRWAFCSKWCHMSLFSKHIPAFTNINPHPCRRQIA